MCHSIYHFSWRSTATVTRIARGSTSSSILSLSPLPFRFRPHLARVRGAQRLVTAPRNSVHACRRIQISLEFISHRSRGCTHCSLSWDTRSHVTISPVKFRFPPPPPRTRPSMSMFTGALSTGRDHLTRQRRVVLYQLHPENNTAQSYSKKSTRVTGFFTTCSATRNGGRGKEISFFHRGDTISRFNSSYITMTSYNNRSETKAFESGFII